MYFSTIDVLPLWLFSSAMSEHSFRNWRKELSFSAASLAFVVSMGSLPPVAEAAALAAEAGGVFFGVARLGDPFLMLKSTEK